MCYVAFLISGNTLLEAAVKWMFVSLQHSSIEIQNHKVILLKGGALGDDEVVKAESS